MRLASLLSFVAGMVNVVGVLAVSTLTTNVTGHFAFFAESFVQQDYQLALIFMVFTISFLAGAFLCTMMVEFVLARQPTASHAAPMFLEMLILIAVGMSPGYQAFPAAVAIPLLFAMGLQNALVTKVSRATVRTTHLTGLFTDLGIELAQLAFFRRRHNVTTLRRSISLRVSIITFFFLGGLAGGYLYGGYDIRALFFAAGSLLIALNYDTMRFYWLLWWRRLRGQRY